MFVLFYTPDGSISKAQVLDVVVSEKCANNVRRDWLYSKAKEMGAPITMSGEMADNGLYVVKKAPQYWQLRQRTITSVNGWLWGRSYIDHDVMLGYVGYVKKIGLINSIIAVPVVDETNRPTTRGGLLAELEQSPAFKRFQALADHPSHTLSSSSD